jgi:hypothetical protein
MDIQSFLNNVAAASFDRVRTGMAGYSNAAPFTGTPNTVLAREVSGEKLFTSNEYFDGSSPTTDNTKKVRSFSKGVDWDKCQFVTAMEPTGNFELIAVDKTTKMPVEKLSRKFPSFGEADNYLHKIHGVANKSKEKTPQTSASEISKYFG